MSYRLLAGAQEDMDRILLKSAREWGYAAAARYEDLLQAVYSIVGETPAAPESSVVDGVRVYPLRLARHLAAPDQRVGRPRHIVVYRVASDGITEIIGIAHDRMLLTNVVRRMLRDADR